MAKKSYLLMDDLRSTAGRGFAAFDARELAIRFAFRRDHTVLLDVAARGEFVGSARKLIVFQETSGLGLTPIPWVRASWRRPSNPLGLPQDGGTMYR
jgi:hypothetical protein